MSVLTIQPQTEAGDEASYVAAAAGGDEVTNVDGDTVLHIKNGHSSAQTVTITAQDTNATNPKHGAVTKADASIAISANGEAHIGPFRRTAFNDSGGSIQITFSGVTLLTIAALTFRYPTG